MNPMIDGAALLARRDGLAFAGKGPCVVTDMRSRPRRLVVLFVFCCFLAIPGILHGQEDAPAEAIPAAADPAQTTGNSPEWRDVSVRKLPTNFLSDQKDLWLFPGQVARMTTKGTF